MFSNNNIIKNNKHNKDKTYFSLISLSTVEQEEGKKYIDLETRAEITENQAARYIASGI